MTEAPLTPAQLHDYQRDGFLVLPQFTDAACLEELRSAYDEILDHAVPAAGDRMLGGVTRQVMFPSAAHRVFDRNPAVAAGLRVSRQIFGTADVVRTFD